MTYAMAAPLQSAVYDHLMADTALQALVAGHVFDAVPAGPLPPLYVILGAESVVDASDGTGDGAWHELFLSVVAEAAGFQTAKEAAGLISDGLHSADLTLSRGRLVGLWFRKAKAMRTSGGVRRIDMIFRARVEDNETSATE